MPSKLRALGNIKETQPNNYEYFDLLEYNPLEPIAAVITCEHEHPTVGTGGGEGGRGRWHKTDVDEKLSR
jgi:hypothetical protein